MKPKILVVDIDGVLADNTHRLYPQNATSYEDSFSRVSDDGITLLIQQGWVHVKEGIGISI